MNVAVLSSLVSLSKGGAFIAETVNAVVTDNIERADELNEEQILGLVSRTIFTILENKESRSLVEMYLIQMHASWLFGSRFDCSFDVCMRTAFMDVEKLLRFTTLDSLGHCVWTNQHRFIAIWKGLIDKPSDQQFAHIAGALDESLELLKAA